MARVLVTGASGFIGKQLVEALIARGDNVTCLVRQTSVVEPLQNLGARLALGDVTDPASLPAALASVDVVYHLAGTTKANSFAGYCQVNHIGAQNVVEACAGRTTPPVLLMVSSLGAAGPTKDGNHLRTESEPPLPVSRYGRSKRAGEQAAEARAGEVPITIVRPPIVLGPGDETGFAMFRGIRWFRSFLVLGTRRRMSIVHVADLVNAILAAAERGERLPAQPSPHDDPKDAGRGCYFIASDEHPDFAELGRMVRRAVGRPRAWPFPLPLTSVWVISAFGELWGQLTRRARYMNLDRARELWAGHWICSAEKARRELGFVPAAPLAERINQTAVWYRDHGWLKSIERSWFVRDESAN